MFGSPPLQVQSARKALDLAVIRWEEVVSLVRSVRKAHQSRRFPRNGVGARRAPDVKGMASRPSSAYWSDRHLPKKGGIDRTEVLPSRRLLKS
jgi:hypothetical protein